MAITLKDLSVSPDSIDREAILESWQWALPEPARPMVLTAMGDVFAQGESGIVVFVDCVEGTVEQVADDGSSFKQMLSDSEFVTTYFFPSRVVQLREAGMTLGKGQVYSHIQPLVLGGDDNVENVEMTDASVHVSLCGQIHRQVKDLPDGASIDQIIID